LDDYVIVEKGSIVNKFQNYPKIKPNN